MTSVRATTSNDHTSAYGTRSRRGRTDAVAAFMLGGSPVDVPAQELIARGLAGYAVARAQALGIELDQSVATARVAMAGRHLVAKLNIATLLRALTDAGLEALVFKGFALAEFEYRDPTWRVYSDVDIALRSPSRGSWTDVAIRASAAAATAGFDVRGRPEVSSSFDSLYGASYLGPALLQLAHRDSGLSVDVHRRVVHNSHDEDRRVALQEAITEAVWHDSRQVVLAATPVRIPAPVDSAVVGLILNRTWSTDSSRLRPHDYLDLETLRAVRGVDQAAIERRSKELGCALTARLFLSRCDPETHTLDLRPPNALTRFYYDTLQSPERGHRTLNVRAREARHLPVRVWWTTRELSNVAMHLRLWRQGTVERWPAEELHDGGTELDREFWRLTQLAVRRAFQLHGVLHPERWHDLALATLMYSLRRRGVPVKRAGDRRSAGSRTDLRSALTLNGEVLRPTVLGITH